MKESDVLTRLGLKDKGELVSLLENSGLNERLFRLASVNRETHSIKLEFYESGCYFKIEVDYTKEVSEIKEEASDYFRRGWSCVLKGSRKTGKKAPENKKTPENYPKEIGVNHFNIGHILGRGFHEFIYGYSCLTPDFKQKGIWKDEAINDKEKNLITQFASANHQTKGAPRYSQAYFEDEVEKFFKDTESGEVFYEVKAIYKKSEDSIDKYPIGTEIYYTTLKPNENHQVIENHVFIPNCDIDFDLSVMGDYREYNSYREFYKNGYSEEYRKYFKNSIDSPELLGEEHHFALVLQEKVLGIYKTSNQVKDKIGNKSISEIEFGTISSESEYSHSFTTEEEKAIILFTKEQIKRLEDSLKGSIYTEPTKKNKYFRPFVNEGRIYLKYYGEDGIASVTHGYAGGDIKVYNSLRDAMIVMKWL